MQEQNWKESLESTKESTEIPTELPPVDFIEEAQPEAVAAPTSKSHLTELRRRIEERLDSKRIAMEYDWDDLDDLADNI